MANVKGTIKVTNIPQGACFNTFEELLASLGQYLTVEIPEQNFSNVVISVAQPGTADVGKIWWRLGGSGTFIGIYTFNHNTGTWVQVYPAPGEVFWLTGTADYPDSDTPPPGWSFTAVALAMSAPQYAAVITPNLFPAGPGPFTFYAALWVGY